MPALGITGGIATGKSTFSRVLRRYLDAELFDVDQCARDLLAQDFGIREAVRRAFGHQAFQPSGEPNRAWIREIIFAAPERRLELEQIVHPGVRERWLAQAAASQKADRWLCIDHPLLFETNAQAHFAAVIVVACPLASQRARLLQNRRLTETVADQIVAAQLNLATKITQADQLIWNDSNASCLDRQARLLAAALRQRHG